MRVACLLWVLWYKSFWYWKSTVTCMWSTMHHTTTTTGTHEPKNTDLPIYLFFFIYALSSMPIVSELTRWSKPNTAYKNVNWLNNSALLTICLPTFWSDTPSKRNEHTKIESNHIIFKTEPCLRTGIHFNNNQFSQATTVSNTASQECKWVVERSLNY